MQNDVLARVIEKQFTAPNMLAAMLSAKLTDKGIDITPARRKILQEQVDIWFEQYEASHDDPPPFHIHFDDNEYAETEVQTTLELKSEDWERLEKRLPELIESVAQTAITKASQLILTEWQEQAAEALRSDHTRAADFNAAVYLTWGRALDALDTVISISTDIGASFNSAFRAKAVQQNNVMFDALRRIHARGCQVSQEILMLLRHGFADGAHARWRTLYELCVTAAFIKKYGNDTANRFLLHSQIDTFREMERHNKYAVKLGLLTTISDDDMREIKQSCDDLMKQFGDGFDSDFGWAGSALGIKRPNFNQIEESIEFEHFRLFYKVASSNVHASSRGTLRRLGQPLDNPNILVAGGSNFGHGEPGRNTVHSIGLLTATFVLSEPSLDYVAAVQALHKLMLDTHEKFYQAEYAQLDTHFDRLGTGE